MAKGKKGKYTDLYAHERRRILNYISRRKRSRYILLEDIDIPVIKKPTKREYEKLKKMTKDILREKFGFKDPDTGEMYTGAEAEKAKRKYNKEHPSEDKSAPPEELPPEDIPEIPDYEEIPDEFELVYNNLRTKLEMIGFADRWLPDPVLQKVTEMTAEILSHMNNYFDTMLSVYERQEEFVEAAYIVQNYEEGYSQALDDMISILTDTPRTLYEKAVTGDLGISWEEPM